MEEFTSITSTSSVVKISSCLEKIYDIIRTSREKQISELQIKEIEFLKTQCKSDNVMVALISCQTFVRLAENNVLDANNVLPLLMTFLPNSSSVQQSMIIEAIISVSLCRLKKQLKSANGKTATKSNLSFKTQQHPIILLLQNSDVNMNDVVNKITNICHHPDEQIKSHSLEYLRPVFLYMLCNPQTLSESRHIWSELITLSKTKKEAKQLLIEILTWSKFTNTSTCIFTNILLTDLLDNFSNQLKDIEAINLCIYQALLINKTAKYGLDPRPALKCLNKVLQATREHTKCHYNAILILLAESLHVLSPYYLSDLLQIIVFIVIDERCGHPYILNMITDGILQWMSQISHIPNDGIETADKILSKLLSKNNSNEIATPKYYTRDFKTNFIRYLHPDIAIAFDLANLVETLDEAEDKDLFAFIDAYNMKSNSAFCQRLTLFIRGLFLTTESAADCWFKIYETILGQMKTNSSIAYDFLMTYIFKLASEKNPEIQLELLRGLPNFGIAKDNIPMLLNTINKFSDCNQTFCMDLYLRLWRVEQRTYPFLIKQISQPKQEYTKIWEYEITRAWTLREICRENATKHGADLVPYLSEILNANIDDEGDGATSLALDAITILCSSKVVNLLSTWRVLRNKLRNEQRPRTLKSLYRFFGEVPNLQANNREYEQLLDIALTELWQATVRSDLDADIINEALMALKNFDLGIYINFTYIPLLYQRDISISSKSDIHDEVIPGEIWANLLLYIRPECGNFASDLVSHHISQEIAGFRSGVYRLPEGKPEPRRFQGLFAYSPLRAIGNFLVTQSRLNIKNQNTIQAINNALRAISKKFSKPIPPLDWIILDNFIDISFETRKHCLFIAKNQINNSASARRFIETFLKDFEPNCFEEDLLLLLGILPEIADKINIKVLKSFAERIAVYCFKESQLSGFAEGCLFETFLKCIKTILNNKLEVPELVDFFTLLVERYMDSMDLESKVFERYTEVVALLNSNSIDGLTSPADWWETPTGKLKKATMIRCYLVLYNTQLQNPIKWLTPIIDAYATKTDDLDFFYRHIAATLYAFNNNERACSWIIELLVQIQSLLSESSNKEKLEKSIYLLDIFILAIDVMSGCAILLGNFDFVATQKEERQKIFPESLQLLCEYDSFWREQEAKIYEFLYNLCKNSAIPSDYSSIFRNALICSRNRPYFDNKTVWTKYVGLQL